MLTKDVRLNEAGEEVEVYLDENGNVVENPTDEQLQEMSDGRPAENLRAELKRKSDELAELKRYKAEREERERLEKEKIESERRRVEPTADQVFRTKMRSLGKTDAEIDVLLEYQKQTISDMSQFQANTMKDVMLESAVQKLKKGSQFEKKFIEQYETEFRDEMSKNHDPRWWADTGCHGVAMRNVLAKDDGKLFKTTAEPSKSVGMEDSPAESRGNPASKGNPGTGVNPSKLAEYIKKSGLDDSTPALRKRAAELMALEERVKEKEKKREQELEKEIRLRREAR